MVSAFFFFFFAISVLIVNLKQQEIHRDPQPFTVHTRNRTHTHTHTQITHFAPPTTFHPANLITLRPTRRRKSNYFVPLPSRKSSESLTDELRNRLQTEAVVRLFSFFISRRYLQPQACSDQTLHLLLRACMFSEIKLQTAFIPPLEAFSVTVEEVIESWR